MPNLPGDQLTKKIRQIPAIAHVPVIIFSAAVEAKQIAREVGAEDFIAKPFDINILCKKIQHLLSATSKRLA